MLFILLMPASKETKEENKSQSKWRNGDATAPFFMLSSCNIVHSENTKEGASSFFFVLSFSYKI